MGAIVASRKAVVKMLGSVEDRWVDNLDGLLESAWLCLLRTCQDVQMLLVTVELAIERSCIPAARFIRTKHTFYNAHELVSAVPQRRRDGTATEKPQNKVQA